MKAGDVVAAEMVPSPALVRDGDGTFFHRRGSFGQVDGRDFADLQDIAFLPLTDSDRALLGAVS